MMSGIGNPCMVDSVHPALDSLKIWLLHDNIKKWLGEFLGGAMILAEDHWRK